jgi:hypothetical protein
MKSSVSAFASHCLVANLSWLSLHSWTLNYWTAFWILLRMNRSGSESELPYDWRLTVNQFVLATRPFRLTTSNSIFQLNTCGCSPYVTSTLTRGWVCQDSELAVEFRSSKWAVVRELGSAREAEKMALWVELAVGLWREDFTCAVILWYLKCNSVRLLWLLW